MAQKVMIFFINVYNCLGVTIFDYIIWNEVNADPWFSLGGYPNTKNGPERIIAASQLYWLSSDLIMSKVSNARVYVSLDHTFTNSTDPPEVSGWDVLGKIQQDSQGKQWHLAIHPYSVNVGGPFFSYADRPIITFGTIGILLGYLQSQVKGYTPTVMITEIGIISNNPSSEQIQSNAICESYRQALATPGITGTYIITIFINKQRIHLLPAR